MRKEDRLHPVITLTVYYGEKQWDGPYSLKDMIVEMSEEIAAIFSDYKMNLLEVRDSAKYVFNNADVQSVFEITRETFAGHFDKIREKYGTKELGADLLTVIGQMTGSKELISMGRNMEVTTKRLTRHATGLYKPCGRKLGRSVTKKLDHNSALLR